MAIDVMLPYYGDVDHFKKAVDSVLAQSYREFRLVEWMTATRIPSPRGTWVRSPRATAG